MNQFDPMNAFPEGQALAPPPTNGLMQMAHDSGLTQAIQQENLFNQSQNQTDYQEAALGRQEADDYADFVEEVVVEAPKRKRANNSKERFSKLTQKIEQERAEKEAALIRAEAAEREQKRLRDEKEFAILVREKDQIEREKEKLSEIWKLAHAEGDVDTILETTEDLNNLNQLKEQYESEIDSVKDRYVKYREEEESEEKHHNEREYYQQKALEEFADARELSSPLLGGFLKNHDFIDPYSPNYDANIVARVEPIKHDLIQELKLNGQYEDIGTSGYFMELSRRIQKNLNPRYRRKEANMNDPRYQEPDYGQIRSELEQSYYQAPPQQQSYYPQQGYAPPPQQQYYQQPQQQPYYQQPSYPQQGYAPQQSYVAPVNRSGYNTSYTSDPQNMALDSLQQEAADLFAGTLNNLSEKVYGRQMDRNEVHDLYKRGLVNQQQRRY